MTRFYFDFSLTYVGAGMICPHLINVSLLLGGIISYGLMWPLIGNKAGDWYPSGLGHSDLKGLYGYKVWTKNIKLVTILHVLDVYLILDFLLVGICCYSSYHGGWSLQLCEDYGLNIVVLA